MEITAFFGGLVNSRKMVVELASRLQEVGPSLSPSVYRGIMLAMGAMVSTQRPDRPCFWLRKRLPACAISADPHAVNQRCAVATLTPEQVSAGGIPWIDCLQILSENAVPPPGIRILPCNRTSTALRSVGC